MADGGARRAAGPLFLLTLLGVLLVMSFVSTTSLLQFLFAPPSTKSYQAELDAMVSTLKAKGAKGKVSKARHSKEEASHDSLLQGQRRAAVPPAAERLGDISKAPAAGGVTLQGGQEGSLADGSGANERCSKRSCRKGPPAARASIPSESLVQPSVESFSINPDSIEAFEAGEEDKEMALIFQIVRMAEQKELQAKQERDAMLAREAAAMGMSLEQFVSQQKSLGSMAESILESPCQSVGDCNSACLEVCTHQRVSDQCQQDCHSRCRTECSGVPPKGSKRGKGAAASAYGQGPECSVRCEGSCRRRCIAEKAAAMEQMQVECEGTNEKICSLQCRGSPKAEQCKGSCIAGALAECRKGYEGGCEAQCGQHVCVEGSCRCPVYFSGDPMCSSVMPIHHMMPDGLKHCSTPFTDDRFKKNSGGNHSVLDYRTRTSPAMLDMHYKHSLRTGARLHPEADLRDVADFSTCAVVGSSSTLSGSQQGAEIDEHTAVIRFNDAPTKGHQADVGSKTTLRLQNVIYCGFHEYQSELCLHYTGFKGNYCPAARQKRFKCNYIWMSNRLLSYVQNFFNRNVFTGMAATKDTSAGFFGILLSLHLCGKVDLYGFNQRASHYFNKQMNSKRAFGDKHAWALERQCMNLFSNLPAVSKRS